jgi:lipoate-protein ligase A
MYQFQAPLETPADNVHADEWLLDAAESGALPGEVLRLWEARHFAVVLGKSSQESEIHAEACAADSVPVLRRVSGGAPVAIGAGCLMYALVLDRRTRPELRGIDGAHRLVMHRMVEALSGLVPVVGRLGTCDLVLPDDNGGPPCKFSGNSLRVKRDWVLYHGTVLYDFPLARISRWLATPRRQPEYRAGRAHDSFVTNFPAPRAAIEQALITVWQAHEPLPPGTTLHDDLVLAATRRSAAAERVGASPSADLPNRAAPAPLPRRG